jgi:GT2 family glycosyltransferase
MQAESAGLRLDIVIVNWNSGPLLARCIASLPRACVDGVSIGSVVVVDNASHDGSGSVQAPTGVKIEVIRNARNIGFAAACNLGARGCREGNILFLNPDTELGPDSLAAPLRRLACDTAGRIGIIGIALVTPQGERQRGVARFPTPASMLGQALSLDRVAPKLVPPRFMTDWDHLDTRAVDQVPGAFMLMRRSDFERLGGFDEQFFVYMEDVDLAFRAREAGLASLYMHDCTLTHVGGGTTNRVKDKRLFYMLRSRVLYARKHFGRAGYAAVVVAAMLLEPLTRLVVAAAKSDGASAREVLRAVGWLWRTYPFRRAIDRGEFGAPSR